MNPTRVIEELKKIRALPHEEMARLWRFAAPGHIYFDITLPLHLAFKVRFASLGGMTPEVSKAIGL